MGESALLGDVATIVMGQSPPGESCNKTGAGVPLLNGPTEFGPRYPIAVQWTSHPVRYAEKNDILFCVRGSTTGRMNVADRQYCIGRGLAAIRGRTDADTVLIHHALRFKLETLLRVATGSTFPNLSRHDIGNAEIPFPSPPQREAIAGVLGAFDDKIESNRRISQLLLEAVELEYFLETSDVDDVPFTTALRVEMGAPFAGDQFVSEGLGRPLIRIRDLKTMRPQVWTTEQRPDEIKVSRGDVLVGMDAEFRSTLWTGRDGVLNQRMCRFVPLPHVGTAFALLAVRPDLEFCERAKSGTTVIHLNKADVDRFRVPNLTLERHRALRAGTQPMMDRIVSLGTESQVLSDLRDALLPELLSGRLRVRDAEKVVEGAV
jgi:type I restriction enzyme S subunit